MTVQPAASRPRRDEGATTVEFALVFPLALLFIGFLVAVGMVAFWSAASDYVARDTARYASITQSNGSYPTVAQLTSHAANDLGGVLGSPVNGVTEQNTYCSAAPSAGQPCTTNTVTGDQSSPRPGEGDVVTVTVTYSVPGIDSFNGFVNAIPGLSWINLDGIATVTRTARARRE